MSKWDKYKERDIKWDEDASYNTWIKIFLPVYSKISLFKENFDFDRPDKTTDKRPRLFICAKENSELMNNLVAELKENVPIEFKPEFRLSGDTDFNISDIDCHRLDNYSLLPITGALNNEKGSKGSGIMEDWAKFICYFPHLIENPKAYNGRYTKELQSYAKEIVKCERKAYFSLFNNDRYQYCYNVYFYGVEEEKDGELFTRAKSMIDCVILNEGKLTMIEGKELHELFWKLRRDILLKKYSIDISKII